MKKITLPLLALTLLSLGSCEKLKEALFPTFDTTVGNIQITIPAMADTTYENMLVSTAVNFNLDSMIKAKTNNEFSLGSVKSVKATNVNITLSNADQTNNIANFATAKVLFSSNINTVAATIASATIPDVAATTLNIPNSNGPELKEYLKGNRLVYSFAGKLRRPTTKDLSTSITITLHVE